MEAQSEEHTANIALRQAALAKGEEEIQDIQRENDRLRVAYDARLAELAIAEESHNQRMASVEGEISATKVRAPLQ